MHNCLAEINTGEGSRYDKNEQSNRQSDIQRSRVVGYRARQAWCPMLDRASFVLADLNGSNLPSG
jgi:hypothetical protein